MQKSYKIVEFREDEKIKDFTVSVHPVRPHSRGVHDNGRATERTGCIYTGDVNLAKTKLLEGADTRNLSGRHANNRDHLRRQGRTYSRAEI